MAAVSEQAKENDRAAKRRHYHENKAQYYARNAAQREALKREVDEIKGSTPCADCGVTYPPFVMDFDHVTGVKIGNVSRMLVTHGRKAVMAEIEKCDVVCFNCHRIRTHERLAEAVSAPA